YIVPVLGERGAVRGADALTHGEGMDAAVVDGDFHGINGDDLALLHGPRGVGLERLDLIFSLGAARIRNVLRPAVVGGEIDDDAVCETVGCDDARHRDALPPTATRCTRA